MRTLAGDERPKLVTVFAFPSAVLPAKSRAVTGVFSSFPINSYKISFGSKDHSGTRVAAGRGFQTNMKLTCILILSLLVPAALSQTKPQNSLSADAVMQKVAAKLASVKRLGYRYKFDYKYPTRNSSTEENAQAYLDLAPADRQSGFRYQFAGENRRAVYNGSENFITDKKSGKLFVESSPTFNRIGIIVLQNSPLTLKYAFPALIAKKSVEKKVSVTKIGGRDHYLVEFSLPKAAMTANGEIVDIKADQTSIYRVTVDKKSLLPVEVVQTNDKNDETLRTTFAELTEKPQEPNALSWYFSSYQKEYRLEKRDPLTLIQAGKIPPAFDLARFGADTRMSLDEFKGKTVLLEFWISHCGFCISAVPKLNQIAGKFRDRDLAVVSINMYDPAETIEFFKQKNKPEYPVLTDGQSIAKAYGVEAYPAIVLIDKNGKIVYSSSGLYVEELEAAILANLQ